MRAWARDEQRETLVKYLQTIIEGYRWGADPAHRSDAVAAMAKHLKIDDEIAAQAVELEARIPMAALRRTQCSTWPASRTR